MAKSIGKSFKKTKAAGDALTSLTKDELLKKAKEFGIEGLTDSNKKDEIIQAIKEHENKE